MYQLTIYSVKERRPKYKEAITWIQTRAFYDAYGFHVDDVEYVWEIVDENGDTGSAIVYDPDVPQPENTRLCILMDGRELRDEDLYILPDDLEDVIDHNNMGTTKEKK